MRRLMTNWMNEGLCSGLSQILRRVRAGERRFKKLYEPQRTFAPTQLHRGTYRCRRSLQKRSGASQEKRQIGEFAH